MNQPFHPHERRTRIGLGLVHSAILGLLTVVCIALQCPGPGGPGTGQPGDMDEAARTTAIAAANAKFESLLSMDEAAARQEMLAWLQSQPEFKNASIQNTEVTAQFTDGVSMVFINNRNGPDPEGAKGLFYIPDHPPPIIPPPDPPPGSTIAHSGRRAFGIPFVPAAYLGSSLGFGYIGADVGPLSGFLAAHGYGIMGGGRASVDELRGNVKNAGVFYLNTHGGVSLCSDGSPVFCLWTDTQERENLRQEWKEDLKNCKLVIASAPYQRKAIPGFSNIQSHFAITPAFVRENMTFCTDSFVYIDSCYSQSEWAADMKKAFFDSGASVYGGWSDRVYDFTAGPATAFLFDRLLGGNDSGIYPEDPKQRPFDYASTLNDMRQRSPRLDHADNTDGTKPFLTFSWPTPDNGSDFGLLAPSIRNVIVDGAKKKIILYGRFGYKQGRVNLGGQDLSIKSWEVDTSGSGQMKIVCDLPDDAFGDLNVFVDNRRSNTYQITQWEIKLTAKDTLIDPNAQGQINLTIQVTLKIRGCLNDWRDKPHQDPVKLGTIATALSPKSTGHISASGFQEVPPNQFGNGRVKITARTVDPQNWIVVNQLGDGDEDDFQIESVSYVQAGNLGPGLKLHLEAAGYWEYEQDDDVNGQTCCSQRPTGLFTNAYFDTGLPVQLPMDGNFNIQAGMAPALNGGTATLEWESAAAQSPPNPTATR